MTYAFSVETIPDTDCLLAVERPEFYRFELNGKTLDGTVKRWWIDRSLQCVVIPRKALKKGENTLVLRTEYHAGLPGLEAMFLLGNFGVVDDTVAVLPSELAIGDWCDQGLPYYAGNVTYSRNVTVPPGGAMLEIANWNGVLLGVRLDDGDEKLLSWPPYRTELPAGKHRLFITVYGSRRNAMGPFYCDTPYPPFSGPAQFRTVCSEKRQLVPGGLLDAPRFRRK